ncbi:MAG: DNA cytosine methyltransferase [Magnetococcales bacterium]|nr:DNA cytosine methyltransferase [Magnetococcales bacterium]
MTAYYNENNPAMAAWLRALIQRGLVADGDVDERSIEDVSPAELEGYHQHHFFAGIGGWSCALRLAGWPDDRPVWTGSCPCQPFSQAGRRLGFADQRHLWPAWHWLIRQCRPATVFGEQVGRVGGARWLDLVCSDLEALDYACGAAVLPACSVGAPHLRQRIFWVANANGQGLPLGPQPEILVGAVRDEGPTAGKGGLVRSPWLGCDWIRLTDGSVRPVEPGTHPLAHGVPARVVKLCGYGNALVPQVAAEFVRAVMECK